MSKDLVPGGFLGRDLEKASNRQIREIIAATKVELAEIDARAAITFHAIDRSSDVIKHARRVAGDDQATLLAAGNLASAYAQWLEFKVGKKH